MSTRDQQTRANSTRKASWKPPTLLPTPDAEAGYSYRWVRTGSHGSVDNRNVSKRFREGWEPVNAKDHPELQILTDRGSQFQDGIEVGGLLLCKTATENVEARNSHYNQAAQNQMLSVDNSFLRESDPRMPLLKPERRSRTTFGKGSEES